MQFRVPQFIDIEDKLFGPLTFKQFIYLAGGAGLVFVIYKTIPLVFAIFLMIPVAGLAAALAFYKPNGKPFIFM
nr:PrgI family protein [Candidatus Paceibacterota bacterium]